MNYTSKRFASKPYASQLRCIETHRYKFLTEFAIYPCGCDIPKGAICPFGTRKRNLYHIATEQSGVISHLNRVKIYRTKVVSISLKSFASKPYALHIKKNVNFIKKRRKV